MWVLLTKGAVSIVQFNHAPEGDPKTMQVRSRRQEWIKAFAAYMEPADGRKIKFIHSDTHDYQWRFFATPEEISAAVGRAVMDISYSNFKNATSAPGTGLRNVKFRNDLHHAYHKVWTTLLDAGDGTSMYDHHVTSAPSGSGTIDICARLGHWWVQSRACQDCKTPRPATWKNGDQLVRPNRAEVAAWWKKNPGKKNRAAQGGSPKYYSTTGTGSVSWSTEPEAGGIIDTTCKGSGLSATKGTLSGNGGVYTGQCGQCGTRVRLSQQTWTIQHHDRPLTPAEAIEAAVDSIPAPSPSVDELEAARDASKDNYLDVETAHKAGNATDRDLDDAVTEYCEAEDAYLAATGTVLGPKATA